MIMFAIYCLTLINVVTAALVVPRYLQRRTIYQLSFALIWTLHYVVGNILVLLSADYTYTLAAFAGFADAYLVSLVVGQYFLWVYLVLLDSARKPVLAVAPFRRNALPPLLLFLAVSLVFAVLLATAIGLSQYFSRELSQYRSNLGEYGGEGIGAFYYLATFLISATLLVGGYAIDHPRGRNLVIALGAIVAAGIFFVPLGGRGRLFNIILVLALTFVLSRREERLTHIFNWRMVVLGLGIIGASFVWGEVRDAAEDASISSDLGHIVWATSVDTTRLPNQAFIFKSFPVEGTYSGLHYIEAALGPLSDNLFEAPVGMIRDYSSLWYAETVGNYDQKSSVSPSFIGEIYLNFGAIGVLLAPLLFFVLIQFVRSLAGRDNPLAIAVILYFFQFNLFHGGLYALFDMLVITFPVIVLCNLLTVRAAGGRVPPRPPMVGSRA